MYLSFNLYSLSFQFESVALEPFFFGGAFLPPPKEVDMSLHKATKKNNLLSVFVMCMRGKLCISDLKALWSSLFSKVTAIAVVFNCFVGKAKRVSILRFGKRQSGRGSYRSTASEKSQSLVLHHGGLDRLDVVVASVTRINIYFMERRDFLIALNETGQSRLSF